ncbi:hypothetical protein ZIOFF_014831 [Zingiber officinale]|uniref:Oxidoreductase FAD/NAD(P)-binding domain-containing protein n=1 Tax=Zingiber officinale TaxID=94328 RepID=A0A8J5HC83_ZINOF|nr:hypothetical protein ZIOFF_014831 [Zingiber officinale]
MDPHHLMDLDLLPPTQNPDPFKLYLILKSGPLIRIEEHPRVEEKSLILDPYSFLLLTLPSRRGRPTRGEKTRHRLLLLPPSPTAGDHLRSTTAAGRSPSPSLSDSHRSQEASSSRLLMLQTLLRRKPTTPSSSDFGATERQGVRLYYGARNLQRMTYQESFKDWESIGVKIIPILSQPDERWSGERGYVQVTLLTN